MQGFIADRFYKLKQLVERELAGDNYIDNDFPDEFLPLWRDYGTDHRKRGLSSEDIVTALRRRYPHLLTVDGYVVPLDLPEIEIELYRGASRDRPLGLSWSTNYDVASSFALLAGDFGAVVIATVSPGAILGAIEREFEGEPPYYEYLIDTADLKIDDIIPRDHPDVLDAAIRDMDRRLESNEYPSHRIHILRWRRRALEMRTNAA